MSKRRYCYSVPTYRCANIRLPEGTRRCVILSRHEKIWVLHERKKLTNNINAVYLYSYSLETTLVYSSISSQFCCRCSRAKHAAKQG